jgi:hypothetical protein
MALPHQRFHVRGVAWLTAPPILHLQRLCKTLLILDLGREERNMRVQPWAVMDNFIASMQNPHLCICFLSFSRIVHVCDAGISRASGWSGPAPEDAIITAWASIVALSMHCTSLDAWHCIPPLEPFKYPFYSRQRKYCHQSYKLLRLARSRNKPKSHLVELGQLVRTPFSTVRQKSALRVSISGNSHPTLAP